MMMKLGASKKLCRYENNNEIYTRNIFLSFETTFTKKLYKRYFIPFYAARIYGRVRLFMVCKGIQAFCYPHNAKRCARERGRFSPHPHKS